MYYLCKTRWKEDWKNGVRVRWLYSPDGTNSMKRGLKDWRYFHVRKNCEFCPCLDEKRIESLIKIKIKKWEKSEFCARWKEDWKPPERKWKNWKNGKNSMKRGLKVMESATLSDSWISMGSMKRGLKDKSVYYPYWLICTIGSRWKEDWKF